VIMFNSRNLGALIVAEEPHVKSWEDGQYNIQNMAIEERVVACVWLGHKQAGAWIGLQILGVHSHRAYKRWGDTRRLARKASWIQRGNPGVSATGLRYCRSGAHTLRCVLSRRRKAQRQQAE